MKKLVSVLLVCSLAFGLCACSGGGSSKKHKDRDRDRDHGRKTEATTEETEEETEEPTEETAAPTATPTPASEGLDGDGGCPNPTVNEGYQGMYVGISEYTVDGEETDFYYPVFEFNTEDARNVNDFIDNLISMVPESCAEGFNYYGSDFFYYTYENALSVVWCLHGDWDLAEYYSWTFDVNTGLAMSNDEVYSLSWCSQDTIREAAIYATTCFVNNLYYDESGEPLIIDCEMNPAHPFAEFSDEYLAEEIAYTFSTDNLQDGMAIAIDSEGTMIFISSIFSFAGAGQYTRVYNYDGINLEHYLMR